MLDAAAAARPAPAGEASEAERLTRERDDAEAALAKARAVLRQVEFDPGGVCPSCSKFEGHAPGCALAALLTPTAEGDRHDGP